MIHLLNVASRHDEKQGIFVTNICCLPYIMDFPFDYWPIPIILGE